VSTAIFAGLPVKKTQNVVFYSVLGKKLPFTVCFQRQLHGSSVATAGFTKVSDRGESLLKNQKDKNHK